MVKRCLWLINHSKLAEWEIPLLKESGYEYIFTPQYVPSNPVFTSGTVNEVTGLDAIVSGSEFEALSKQDWYDEIQKEAASVANKHFDLAFVTADPKQVINVLRAFNGKLVIRLFGLDSARTYSQLYSQHYSPSEWKFFTKNLHRIVFATGYREILVNEESWITDNSVYLPIGLPPGKELEWTGDCYRLFAVVPRIEPGTYFSNMLKSHFQMAGNSPTLIGGRQHLVFKDSRILGALKDSEFYSVMLRSRAMLYASREESHVHYHPIEAMQAGMPVVFYRESLLGSLLGHNLIGSVKTQREARKLSQELLRDPSFAHSVGKAQKNAVRKLEAESLAPAFLHGMSAIEDRNLSIATVNEARLVLCSQSDIGHECASEEIANSRLIRFEPNEFSLVGPEGTEVKIELTTPGDLLKSFSNRHSFSRIFHSSRSVYSEIKHNSEFDQVVLCGMTLPGVNVSTSALFRYVSKSLVMELRKEPYDPEIEDLRYSLPTLDALIVKNSEDKDVLVAFAPINPRIVRIIENV